MILKADEIARRIESPGSGEESLIITPRPGIEELKKSGTASVDLRLGTWIVSLRQSRISKLGVPDGSGNTPGENRLTRQYYVPFGKSFILHPKYFVLGVTLEWMRLPKDIAGYVIGKSSWGRYGLIIATAVGVHPGFAGCLTLELSNVGELPIELKPGMQICQLFLHHAHSTSSEQSKSLFVGQRKPRLGSIAVDDVAKKLIAAYQS
jgi:dCTP deaminase